MTMHDKRAIRRIELAQDILRLARKSNWQKGRHLTETSLARILEVSRSPIRAALRELEEWGAVSQRTNHGFFLSVDAPNLDHIDKDQPPTPEDALYLQMLDLRLAGGLEDVVTQVDVMHRFDRPRAIVERVLSRMVDEGLMDRLKGKGWRFQPMFQGPHSWEKGYEIRLMLEPSVFMLPEFSIDSGALEAAKQDHQRLHDAPGDGDTAMSKRAYRIDAAFHEMIAGFSGNGFIVQTVQHQNRLRRLLEHRGYPRRHRIDDWRREHLAIIDRLERGRLQEASDLMTQHLTRARDATRGLLT